LKHRKKNFRVLFFSPLHGTEREICGIDVLLVKGSLYSKQEICMICY
jgi:hypothetical protein